MTGIKSFCYTEEFNPFIRALEKLAKREGIADSEIIRRCIADYVDRQIRLVQTKIDEPQPALENTNTDEECLGHNDWLVWARQHRVRE